MPYVIKLVLCAFILTAAALPAAAQPAAERTIDEIRDESIARSERGGYPLIGLSPDDVREAFSKITSRDGDEWAAAWTSVAGKYAARAKDLAASDPAASRANWLKAWRLHAFGAWPVASTPGKQKAYETALAAFLAAARTPDRTLDPPLEVVRIPFEGREIVGYLRVPKAASAPAPLVFAISGLDSRKENLMDQFAPVLSEGIAIFAVDSPGTGQSPVKASPSAERVFSAALDYLATRKEIDASRIVLHGVSFGGYWAAKLAIVEKARLKAVSAQSPAVHDTFQPEFLKNRISGNREYLFDYVPAQIAVFEGVSTVEDLVAIYPKMSLVTQGLLGKPTPPMLIVGGALDTQVPISDAYRLLSAGDTPKDAWINPAGGHLGRQTKVWPDPVIFEKVITPYIVRRAKGL
jgi:dipeptidyl aminopeptidase/acylaminoacyl peptidase